MNQLYKKMVDRAEYYGIPKQGLCKSALSVEPAQIQRDVIIAPWWYPDIFEDYTAGLREVGGDLFQIWELDVHGRPVTYLRTGVGANRILDATLALGTTPCENVVFIGSVAGLREEIEIGGLFIPRAAVSGDGACRYVTQGSAAQNDCFGKTYQMNPRAYSKIESVASAASGGVPLYRGVAFSIDTIFAEFMHIEEARAFGCDCLEMELAALYCAAEAADLCSCALCSVSDNIAAKKTLYYGRSDAERKYRIHTRKTVLTKIVLDYITA